MLCHEVDVEAPRDRCRCWECCRERERLLDPWLIEMVRNSAHQLSEEATEEVLNDVGALGFGCMMTTADGVRRIPPADFLAVSPAKDEANG